MPPRCGFLCPVLLRYPTLMLRINMGLWICRAWRPFGWGISRIGNIDNPVRLIIYELNMYESFSNLPVTPFLENDNLWIDKWKTELELTAWGLSEKGSSANQSNFGIKSRFTATGESPWGRHDRSPTGLHRNSVGINERKQSRLSSVRSGITRLQPNRFITSITPTCHAATMWLSLAGALALPTQMLRIHMGLWICRASRPSLDWIYIQEHTTEAE